LADLKIPKFPGFNLSMVQYLYHSLIAEQVAVEPATTSVGTQGAVQPGTAI